jgi:hypothetical protein
MVVWEHMHHNWGGFERRLKTDGVLFSLRNAEHLVQELPVLALPNGLAAAKVRQQVEDIVAGLEISGLGEPAKRFLRRSLLRLLEALEWDEVIGPNRVSDDFLSAWADFALVKASIQSSTSADSSSAEFLSTSLKFLKGGFLAYQVVHDLLEAGDTLDRIAGLIQ